MKKTICLSILIICNIITYAQADMLVKSFNALPNDLDAIDKKYEKKDYNGETAAIIKIVTQETGFTFDIGVLGIVATEQHVGEIWVYVPHRAQHITIKHQQLGVLRDYYFPIAIDKARVYEMVLSTDKIFQVLHSDVGGQYVVLNIEPKIARVSVEGCEEESVIDGYYEKFHSYGEYNFTISARDYVSEKMSISVSHKKIEKQINLIPNFGSLDIITNVEEAHIYINDEKVGSRFKLERLPFGVYDIMVYAEGYIEERFTVKISEAKEYIKKITLEKNTVSIKIDCNLVGATLHLGNRKLGNAPWQGELLAGEHIIEARKEGYRPTKMKVSIERGIPQDITIDAPQPKYGTINISANERNVNVWIDGELLGFTPNIFPNILEGEHQITLRKKGFKDFVETITIKEGAVLSLKGEIKPMPKTGKLSIISTPITNVYINDKYAGKSLREFELKPNYYYNIRLEKKGYHDAYIHNAFVKSGEVTKEKVKLEREKYTYYADRRNRWKNTVMIGTSISSSMPIAYSLMYAGYYNILGFYVAGEFDVNERPKVIDVNEEYERNSNNVFYSGKGGVSTWNITFGIVMNMIERTFITIGMGSQNYYKYVYSLSGDATINSDFMAHDDDGVITDNYIAECGIYGNIYGVTLGTKFAYSIGKYSMRSEIWKFNFSLGYTF